MRYRTYCVQLAGQKYAHYTVNSRKALCGENLKDEQTKLIYDNELDSICPQCRTANKPRFRSWALPKKIHRERDAKHALSVISLYYGMLDEDVRIYWGLYEFKYYRENPLTNFLEYSQAGLADIEGKVEDEERLRICYGSEGEREYREIPFDRIKKYHSLITEDILDDLQTARYTN